MKKTLFTILTAVLLITLCVLSSGCENDDRPANNSKATHDHDFEIVEKGKDPTCGNTGLTDSKKCKVCNELVERQDVIPATGKHTFNDQSVCTQCGYELKATEGLTYQKTLDKTGYIVNGFSGSDAVIYIPSCYNGLPVRSIADSVFQYNSSITEIHLPNTLTSIGMGSFVGCTGLHDVTIPSSVETISDSAFLSCTGIKNLTISNGVKNIGSYAFGQCHGLSSVHIPSSVLSIGDGAFSNCSGLESFTVDEGNTVFTSKGKILYNESENALISAPAKLQGDVTIDESTKKISIGAFFRCTEITSIKIPNGITRIEDNTFFGCDKLKKLNIPHTVSELGENIFGGDYDDFGEHIQCSCSNLTYKIFGNCKYLGDKTNPYLILVSAKEKSIKSCEINSKTQFILGSAFMDCTELKSITLPNGITTIGSKAFYGCSKLESITIPDSVTKIGASALEGCTNLKDITVPFLGPSPEKYSIDDISYIYGIYGMGYNNLRYLFSSPTSDIYQETPLTLETVVITGGTIDGSAFSGFSSVKNITIPDTISEIPSGGGGFFGQDSGAFSGCNGLRKLTLPSSIISFGSGRDIFGSFVELEIYYNGTKTQWKNIRNSYALTSKTWDFIVHCTDGDIHDCNSSYLD